MPVPIPAGPVLVSQQALHVPTAVFGQCGKLCAAGEATRPHLQKATKLCLLLCLTRLSQAKALCRLESGRKEGWDFSLASLQTMR